MEIFRADLHTHTILSPCGDLEMTPRNIIDMAVARNIDIIGITDHNSTLNALTVKSIGEEAGILVMTGAEVNTREEIHTLCFFNDEGALQEFQGWLEREITRVPNSVERFGYQVVVDEDDNIRDQVDYLLLMALRSGIEDVARFVSSLGGLFIPAHVDRPVNSIISQLGFFPPSLTCDAIELTPRCSRSDLLEMHPFAEKFPIIRSSDSHYISTVGDVTTRFLLKDNSYGEVVMALKGEGGRKIIDHNRDYEDNI